jgi:hypothetical protein
MMPLLAAGNIVWDPIVPGALVGIIGVAFALVTGWSYLQLAGRLSRWKNSLLLLFRLAGSALVLLLLLQPSKLETIPPPQTHKVTLVALDTSRSMNQKDVENTSRIDSAKQLLADAGLNGSKSDANAPSVRVFQFHEDATPITTSVAEVLAEGTTTRIHHSVVNTLNSLAGGETAQALILFTDGHDFDLINPTKTGFIARSRQTPIYAVPFGKQGKVRDVSTRIANYQPYCYVKQKARIKATLRFLGCEFENINVQLVRENKVVQTKRIDAGEQQTTLVEFEVTEPEIGQFEYEVRAAPLQGEIDAANNSAITYLNVIDQQIQVLVLEGAPYWDTTFLQRSLMRNDKMEVDSAVQYAPQKVRLVRRKVSTQDLKLPRTAEEFNQYDIIILGQAVDHLIDKPQLAALQEYVRDRGGVVIFSRGKAFAGDLSRNDLEPVIWENPASGQLRVQASREGQATAPFRTLAEQGGVENLPKVVAGRKSTDKKTLTATLALGQNEDDGNTIPAIVHRRHGEGQVLSVGVDGLWRWGFNPKVDGPNNAFDRFWDQMILWLMAARDFVPTRQFSFRTSSANILLGEKVHFRLVMRAPDASVKTVPLQIFQDTKPVGGATFSRSGEDPSRLTADFLPEKPGKYRAVAQFPDGTQQESKFIVFNENVEETEVATDVTYLKRLCESSGGRLLAPDEVGRLVEELRQDKSDIASKFRLHTIWDRTWIFYLIGLLFGVDWYLRRRWGLC